MDVSNKYIKFLENLAGDRARMLDNLINHLDGMLYVSLLDEDRTMVFISEGCKALTGYSADELTSNKLISYQSLIHEEDIASFKSAISMADQALSRFELEYRIRHSDGSAIWVYERGSPIMNEANELLAIEGYIQNITLRKNAEQALKITEARYRSIFENSLEGIFQTTPAGQYLMVNPSLARMYGYESPESLIKALNNIQQQLYVSSTRRDEFERLMANEGRAVNFESEIYRQDGSAIWISENARGVHDESGALLYYEGTVQDISSRKDYERQIQHQATHDSLTGLPNRDMLNDRLFQYIHFAARYKHQLAVVFIDLDHFKRINDSMGHETGDLLLVEISQRLSKCTREIDTVARLGGDEFVMLIANIQQLEDLAIVMERVLHSVSLACVINGWDFIVSCSMGISLYPDHGKNANDLLKNADLALHRAKLTGRNKYQIYTHELNVAMTERVAMEYQLRLAVQHKEFILHYQPKVDFTSGKICGVEALIRWQPPGKPLVPPIRFIPVAEETGLIDPIGEWVMITACETIKQLHSQTQQKIPVAVNVSARQFMQPNLVESIRNILIKTELEPAYLELEITESLVIDNPSKFIETLHALKNIGLKIAIDDFGTGYSSLAYLKDFPIDRLKIDKSFIDTIDKQLSSAAILKAIVLLGHSLGIKVIAEGVESENQYHYLQSIGCDELQGYFFSKPIPVDQLETLIIKTNQALN